ncbi:hypothetical protein ACGFWE_08180 [Streptomyces sp. NPDC048523]|uniref:hypothetical protein n=1 Tax=Streptomyces sp. NPDC048523 TaxID=3365567 RepID=UPI003710B8E3
MPAHLGGLSGTYLRENPDGSLSVTPAPYSDNAHLPRWDQPPSPAVGQVYEGRRADERIIFPRARARRMRALRQPELVAALNARDMTLATGEARWIDAFASKVLVLNRSERWRRAVSSALLGNWCAPLAHGHLGVEALGRLKTEAQRIYRQERPLFERGTRKGRMLSLDAPLGDNLNLYDVLDDGQADLYELVTRGMITDERLVSLLKSLKPDELAVLLARAGESGVTWTEAAALAGADEPAVLGERVRRKVKRLVDAQHKRHDASGGQWLPGPRGGRS